LRRLVFALALLGACTGSEPSEDGPRLVALGPNTVPPLVGAVAFVAHGGGFRDSAVVERDGIPLETIFVSDIRLIAFLPGDDVAQPDTFLIAVRNPNGQVSNVLPFVVTPEAAPLVADSTTPGAGAEVNPDTTVAVYFSEALDPGSLTDTSLLVRDETGARMNGTAAYDAAARVLRWTGGLPGPRRYTASLSDEIYTTAGGALGGPIIWSFTTSLGTTLSLEANAAWPTLVLGTNGWPRVAYRTQSRVRLASCSGSCLTPSLWSIASVGALAGADYLTLALAPTGALHFAMQDPSGFGAIYSRQNGPPVLLGGEAAYTALGVSGTGVLHLLFYRQTDLVHATCSAGCDGPGGWQETNVDTEGDVGSFPSVAVDAGGAVHVTYFESGEGDLRYAVCAAPCTTPSWVTGEVETAGRSGVGSSLLVDGTGRLHATWISQTEGTVVYGTCAAECAEVAEWNRTVVEPIANPAFSPGWYYTSLASGPSGLELSYNDASGSRLRGASCAADCAGEGAWSAFTVSLFGGGEFGDRMTSLRVDAGGQRHVAWTDASGAVRYTRY
jgi:hypothetical protein